jgi:hypothetical protein
MFVLGCSVYGADGKGWGTEPWSFAAIGLAVGVASVPCGNLKQAKNVPHLGGARVSRGRSCAEPTCHADWAFQIAARARPLRRKEEFDAARQEEPYAIPQKLLI